MTVEQWIFVWKAVVICGISVFSILAVVVTIGGFFDIRHLFRKLHAQHAEQQEALNAAPEDRDDRYP